MLICQPNEAMKKTFSLLGRVGSDDISLSDDNDIDKNKLDCDSQLNKYHNISIPSIFIKNDCNNLITSINKNVQLTFTNIINLNMFQIIRNHFSTIFKIHYTDEFFHNIYNGKYYSIVGVDKETKEIVCFSQIDIDKKEKTAKILAIGVVNEYQGRKLGTQLMNKVLEELLVFGIKDVSLTFQEVNEIAVKLYLKFGFYIDKEIEEYYNFKNLTENKALLMRKTLNSNNWAHNLIQTISGCFGSRS